MKFLAFHEVVSEWGKEALFLPFLRRCLFVFVHTIAFRLKEFFTFCLHGFFSGWLFFFFFFRFCRRVYGWMDRWRRSYEHSYTRFS
jgi:hypothetical protein